MSAKLYSREKNIFILRHNCNFVLIHFVSVSLPEITPELAEQIVNQVAIQHESSSGEAEISPNTEAIQVIEVSSDQTTGNLEEQTIGGFISQVILILVRG